VSLEPNKQRLAVVVPELDANRGPDVRVKVGVPSEWIAAAASISVVLPRLAACAQCSGGGCERCNGRGALPLRGLEEPPTQVEVHLTPVGAGQTLVVRLPDLGPAPDIHGAKGCVLLEVEARPVATKNVTLVTVVTSSWIPSWQPWAALVGALCVILIVAYCCSV
jgi:hypothetical protein